MYTNKIRLNSLNIARSVSLCGIGVYKYNYTNMKITVTSKFIHYFGIIAQPVNCPFITRVDTGDKWPLLK